MALHKKSQIVVISSQQDGHVDFVRPHLPTSASITVVDPSKLLEGQDITYEISGGSLAAYYDRRKLGNVVSVWYRKPPKFEAAALPVPQTFRRYSQSALETHAKALSVLFPGALWVSDYFAMLRAEQKPAQLAAALRLGFNVPPAVFTSSAAAAQTFMQKFPAVIVKPQARYFPPSEPPAVRSFFATKIRRGEPLDLSGLHLAPAIFQQAIDAAADIRVTVVGAEVFAARITTHGQHKHSKTRDWRIGHFKGSLQIQPYRLPQDIADKCLRLVRHFGLQYSAMDFVLDTQGQLWFLESNANGQWAFIEEATKQPIGKALARLLARGKEIL